jgi:hypothetical protein
LVGIETWQSSPRLWKSKRNYFVLPGELSDS